MASELPTPDSLRVGVLDAMARLPETQHLAAARAIDRGEVELIIGEDDVVVVVAGLWRVSVRSQTAEAV